MSDTSKSNELIIACDFCDKPLLAALEREETLKSKLMTVVIDELKLIHTKMDVDAKLFAALEREKKLQARISALEQEKRFSNYCWFIEGDL